MFPESYETQVIRRHQEIVALVCTTCNQMRTAAGTSRKEEEGTIICDECGDILAFTEGHELYKAARKQRAIAPGWKMRSDGMDSKIYTVIKFQKVGLYKEEAEAIEINEIAFFTFEKAEKYCRDNWDEKVPRMIQGVKLQ